MLGMHLHFQRFLTPKKSVRPFRIKGCVCIPLKIQRAASAVGVDTRTELPTATTHSRPSNVILSTIPDTTVRILTSSGRSLKLEQGRPSIRNFQVLSSHMGMPVERNDRQGKDVEPRLT